MNGTWRAAAAAIVAAFLLATASHYTLGELSMDDASSFFAAREPLRSVLILPARSQGQPPLFFVALHAWLGFGDSEPVLRALPMVCMLAAALTLLSAQWLAPATRVVALGVLLLGTFSDYLTPTIRPYAMTAWFSLWSCLELGSLLREPRQGWSRYARYTVSALLLAYTLTLAIWALIAHGLSVVAAVLLEARRCGLRDALRRYRALLSSLAFVAVLYVPHAFSAYAFQTALDRPSLWVTLAAALRPRYYVSGPLYLLAMPARLGWLAAAAALAGVWRGLRDRDPFVGLLIAIVVVQIAATHALLEGRYGFSFRYLTPAFPALCLLAGLGAEWLAAAWRRIDVFILACAGGALAAALVLFVRAPRTAPVGPWRQVAEELRRMPGRKVVFFDVGWDGQPLRYESRHDSSVVVRTFAGSGWTTFGQKLTADYVSGMIDRDAAEGGQMFYQLDAMLGSAVFDTAFVPGMRRHGCAMVTRRVVPTLARDDANGHGGLLYGYRCTGG